MSTPPFAGATGILGGAFDPPHVGHVTIASEALRQLGLASLVIVVTGTPPHKQVMTDAEVRLELAELAFAGLDRAWVSRIELDRPGPSYSLDTIRWAKAACGDVVFVLGADEFVSFRNWHRPAEILNESPLAVSTRAGVQDEPAERARAELDRPERVTFFEIPNVAASSTEARERVAAGQPVSGMVPPEVAARIVERGLYLDQKGS